MIMMEEPANTMYLNVITQVLLLSAKVLLHFVPLVIVMMMPKLVTYILAIHLKHVTAVLTHALVWLLTFLTLSVLNLNGMGLFLCGVLRC